MRKLLWVLSSPVFALCSACASENNAPESAAPPYPVDLPAPAHGLQTQTVGRVIPAGADEEWCEVVELPGDPSDTYYVGRLETEMTPFSHHLTISYAPEGSPRLDQEPLGKPVECAGAHAFGPGMVALTGASKTYVSDDLPPGIGHVLHGRQRLLFDYHALNTSQAPIVAAHRLNLHFTDRIDKQARLFGFYNQYIQIPPRSSAAFLDECSFSADILVWSLSRHTHRRGTSFQIWQVGGARDGEHLWTSTDWEQDIAFRFAEPVVMAKGTGLRWECAFDNPTDETLIFGPEATDEMCILFGRFVGAGEADTVPPQSCYRFTP